LTQKNYLVEQERDIIQSQLDASTMKERKLQSELTSYKNSKNRLLDEKIKLQDEL